jgi:hydroxymethylbilane synthase
MIKLPGIFISRSLEESSPLKILRTLGYQVTDESLIKTTQIRFSHTPKSDWIFFSSKNAIRYFFSQNPTPQPKVRYAVFGKGSAEMLARYGKKADFIGNGNDATAIARQFISLVDGDIILFPQAIDSFRTVQRWLPFNNITRNLFVYKTELRNDFDLPEADVLVFTSPSNVNAYYSKYRIKLHQQVIAIGTTTRLSLRSKGIRDAIIPEAFDEVALLDQICRLCDIDLRSRDQPSYMA